MKNQIKCCKAGLWSLALIFALFTAACSGTELGDQVSISSEGGGTSDSGGDDTPVTDTTPPVLAGVITSSTDSALDRSATHQWPTASDETGLSHYLIAVAEDDSSGTCEASDFSSPTLTDRKVPAGADFAGAGYQLVNGALDGDGGALAINLRGDTAYCTRVVAVDTSNNVSGAIFSSSPWNFLYNSCSQAKTNEASLTDGVYNIDPDGVGGDASYPVFCDMTTQGGGWTLVIRYDSSQANASAYFLPTGTGQNFSNLADLQNLNTTGNLVASANMVPFIQNGATMLMHVGKPDDGATDSSTYARVYFSDIYQAVIDTPTNIFNQSLDTDAAEPVSGTIVNGFSAVRKDRWYEADMTEMTVEDTDGDTANSYRIDGGEGDAMFTNGSREGALYCTGASSSADGHGDPKVQWGFQGKDGSSQTYGGTIYIGTHCSSALACAPENPINMMFIR